MTVEQKLRALPAIDALLQRSGLQALIAQQGRQSIRDRLRRLVEEVRAELRAVNQDDHQAHDFSVDAAAEIERRLHQHFQNRQQALTQRVINATGIILHTNLGRAPLSQTALETLHNIARGYCNLEYDLETGMRGQRGAGLEALLCEMLGAEAAVVVNNCAAAVYLTLNTLAEGGEVLVSRGELIEIGGSFRLPEVIAKSGARLREVGTTNRTRLSDFAAAINDQTKVILRSHPSNYRIIGFTERPAVSELAQLARTHGIPFFEDLGSGALLDLSLFGIHDEPTVQHSLQAGASLIAFSGDKLLGGPQAGLILGQKELIAQIKRNPMMRAFRVDKMIFSTLEATIREYAQGTAVTNLPALAALHASQQEVGRRARNLQRRVRNQSLIVQIVDGNSMVGGGSAPQAVLPTKLLRLTSTTRSAAKIAAQLRHHHPPIIGRIEQDQLMLDLRTVQKSEENELLAALNTLT